MGEVGSSSPCERYRHCCTDDREQRREKAELASLVKWNERDSRERRPTIRFPADWHYANQMVLKTDADLPLMNLHQMGSAALMDLWPEELPKAE